MYFFVIEFLDELVFGVQDAAWPLIRDALSLSYVQIGLLLSLPGILANLVEPSLFVLGDIWRRRTVILLGGTGFVLALALAANSGSFLWLLLALVLFNPSSGAFVSLSQASLMDAEPRRRELNMARWNFAGSLGVFTGPLLLGAIVSLGAGWRHAFWLLAGLSAVVLWVSFRGVPHATNQPAEFPGWRGVLQGFRRAAALLRTPPVLRWLVLLEFSDLTLDVFYGFLALYFVDVAGLSPGVAAMAVAVWTGAGLLGDLVMIPLLARVSGLRYLRLSVWLELVLFPAFLLVSTLSGKLIWLGLLGLFSSGWYAILRAQLYEAAPGSSGTVLALDNITGMLGRLLPLLIALAAQQLGLATAMWLLLLGPVALLVGLPRGHGARMAPNE